MSHVSRAQMNRVHHNFEDPAAVEGSEEQRLDAFRKVRGQIRSGLRQFPDGFSDA